MYITRDDLIERFGEAEIMQLERSIKDANAVDTAIEDACIEVDGYVARQYSLPLPVVTKSLKRAVATIARYYLWKDKASDKVQKDYDDMIAWLDKVANGKVYLVFGLESGNSSNTGDGSTFASGAFVI